MKKILNKIIFLVFLIKSILSFELEFKLENIPKSIIYKTHDDIFNDYYIYQAINPGTSEDIKIIYQTSNIIDAEETNIISYNDIYKLTINKFTDEDCNSNNINLFLYCKDDLKSYFYGYINIFKTLDNLYNDQKITNKIFGQEYSDTKDKLKIFIGDITSMTSLDKYKYRYKCELNNINNIAFNYISLIPDSNKDSNNITNIQINSNAEINSAYNNIKGSYDVGEKIFSYILSLPLFKDKCYISTGKSISIEDEYIKLICNSDINIIYFPKIVFSFGNKNQVQIVLNSDNFFYKQYDVFGEKFFYVSNIEFSKLNKNWIIGRPLLNDVNLIFDLDKNILEFIYKDDKYFYRVELNTSSNTIKKVLLIFLIIIVIGAILATIWFAWLFMKNKKNKIKLKDFMDSNVQSLEDM